ncbi:unnamed protein product, partial [Musa acuminata var. zebrina]
LFCDPFAAYFTSCLLIRRLLRNCWFLGCYLDSELLTHHDDARS